MVSKKTLIDAKIKVDDSDAAKITKLGKHVEKQFDKIAKNIDKFAVPHELITDLDKITIKLKGMNYPMKGLEKTGRITKTLVAKFDQIGDILKDVRIEAAKFAKYNMQITKGQGIKHLADNWKVLKKEIAAAAKEKSKFADKRTGIGKMQPKEGFEGGIKFTNLRSQFMGKAKDFAMPRRHWDDKHPMYGRFERETMGYDYFPLSKPEGTSIRQPDVQPLKKPKGGGKMGRSLVPAHVAKQLEDEGFVHGQAAQKRVAKRVQDVSDSLTVNTKKHKKSEEANESLSTSVNNLAGSIGNVKKKTTAATIAAENMSKKQKKVKIVVGTATKAIKEQIDELQEQNKRLGKLLDEARAYIAANETVYKQSRKVATALGVTKGKVKALELELKSLKGSTKGESKELRELRKQLKAAQRDLSAMNKKLAITEKRSKKSKESFQKLKNTIKETNETVKKGGKDGKKAAENLGFTGLAFGFIGGSAAFAANQIRDEFIRALEDSASMLANLQRAAAFTGFGRPGGIGDPKALETHMGYMRELSYKWGLTHDVTAELIRDVEKATPLHIDSKEFARVIAGLAVLEPDVSVTQLSADLSTIMTNFPELTAVQAADLTKTFAEQSKLTPSAAAKNIAYMAQNAQLMNTEPEDIFTVASIMTAATPGEKATGGRGARIAISKIVDPKQLMMFEKIGVNTVDAEGKLIGLKDVLDDVRVEWNEWSDLKQVQFLDLFEFPENAKTSLQSYLNAPQEAIDAAADSFKNAEGAWKHSVEAQAKTLEASLNRFQNYKLDVQLSLGMGMQDSLAEINDLIARTFNDSDLDFIVRYGEAIGATLSAIAHTVVPIIKWFSDVLKDNWLAMGALGVATVAVVGALGLFTILFPIIGGFYTLRFISGKLIANYVKMEGKVDLLTKAYAKLYYRWVGFSNRMKLAINNSHKLALAKYYLANAFKALGRAIKSSFLFIAGPIYAGISNALSGIKGQIGKLRFESTRFVGVWSKFIGVMHKVQSAMVSGFSYAAHGIMAGFHALGRALVPVFVGMAAKLGLLFGVVFNIITHALLFAGAWLQKMFVAVGAIFVTAGTTIGTAFGAAYNVAVATQMLITHWLTTVMTPLTTKMAAWGAKLGAAWGTAWSVAAAGIMMLWNWLKNVFTRLAGRMAVGGTAAGAAWGTAWSAAARAAMWATGGRMWIGPRGGFGPGGGKARPFDPSKGMGPVQGPKLGPMVGGGLAATGLRMAAGFGPIGLAAAGAAGAVGAAVDTVQQTLTGQSFVRDLLGTSVMDFIHDALGLDRLSEKAALTSQSYEDWQKGKPTVMQSLNEFIDVVKHDLAKDIHAFAEEEEMPIVDKELMKILTDQKQVIEETVAPKIAELNDAVQVSDSVIIDKISASNTILNKANEMNQVQNDRLIKVIQEIPFSGGQTETTMFDPTKVADGLLAQVPGLNRRLGLDKKEEKPLSDLKISSLTVEQLEGMPWRELKEVFSAEGLYQQRGMDTVSDKSGFSDYENTTAIREELLAKMKEQMTNIDKEISTSEAQNSIVGENVTQETTRNQNLTLMNELMGQQILDNQALNEMMILYREQFVYFMELFNQKILDLELENEQMLHYHELFLYFLELFQIKLEQLEINNQHMIELNELLAEIIENRTIQLEQIILNHTHLKTINAFLAQLIVQYPIQIAKIKMNIVRLTALNVAISAAISALYALAAAARAAARRLAKCGCGGKGGKGKALGGVIPELVIGVGQKTGTTYTFGERGPEWVIPNHRLSSIRDLIDPSMAVKDRGELSQPGLGAFSQYAVKARRPDGGQQVQVNIEVNNVFNFDINQEGGLGEDKEEMMEEIGEKIAEEVGRKLSKRVVEVLS